MIKKSVAKSSSRSVGRSVVGRRAASEVVGVTMVVVVVVVVSGGSDGGWGCFIFTHGWCQ